MGIPENFTAGGIKGDSTGTLVVTTEQGRITYACIQWRTALALEIRSSGRMIASRGMNAATIIPQLRELGITQVEGRLTMARKRQAWHDLDAWMTARGFTPGVLDRPARKPRPGFEAPAATAAPGQG